MKRALLIIWLLGSLVPLVSFASSYWLGYARNPLALFAASDYLLFGIELLLFLAVVVITIRTFVSKQKEDRRIAFITFCAFWPALFAITYLFILVLGDDGDLIMRGLRDRLDHEYTFDRLPQIARDIEASGLLSNPSRLVDLASPPENQQATLLLLHQKYPFLVPMPSDDSFLTESIRYEPDTHSVRFDWWIGSRYWGFSISTDGTRASSYPEYEASANQASSLHPRPDFKLFYYDSTLD